MRWYLAVVVVCTLCGVASLSSAADALPASVTWHKGPVQATLGQLAEIQVPDTYVFADAADTRVLLEAMQNPTSGQEMGFLAPDSLEWFVIFEFSDVGYIKDDDQDRLDASAMLQSIQEGTEQSNAERRKRGWATLRVIGWEPPPHYDTDTHHLTWAIRGESEGTPVVNYNTRLLGRKGVMRVSLVVEPSQLGVTVPVFKGLLRGYTFKSGERYAEFRAGDKVAEYGLAALVTGGAAAVALKTGFLAKAWKVITKFGIVIVIAVGALLKRLFWGRRSSPYPGQGV